MSAVLVSKENNSAVFTAEIPAAEFDAALETAYRKNKQHFSIPGFRKGKVPRKLLERNYGASLFYEDAINEILPQAFESAVEELELSPVAQPDVDIDEIEKGKDVKLKFTVDLKPEPVLGEYKGAEVEIPKFEITDEQIDMKLSEQQEANARIIPVEDRAAEEGDIAVIDYLGSIDDVPFEGGEAENYELTLGSGTFIPGFEEQVAGHKPGEAFDVNVTFPENYREPMAGKDAKFEVKLHSLKHKELPALDDDFALDVSEFDTLDAYKADIRKGLQDELDKRMKIEKENAAIEKLIEVSEISIPDSMVNHQIDHEYEEMAREIQQMGIGMDQYMSILQKTESGLREELRPKALKRLQADLVLEALRDKMEVEVSDEETEQKIEELVEGVTEEQREDYRKFLTENRNTMLVENLKIQKVIDSLVADMTFTEVEHLAHDHDHDHNHDHDHDHDHEHHHDHDHDDHEDHEENKEEEGDA